MRENDPSDRGACDGFRRLVMGFYPSPVTKTHHLYPETHQGR